MKMRVMVVALAVTLALALPAAATGQATRAIEACGTLRAYSAPTVGAPGSVLDERAPASLVLRSVHYEVNILLNDIAAICSVGWEECPTSAVCSTAFSRPA